MKNLKLGVKLSDTAILDKIMRLKQVFRPSDIVLGFPYMCSVSGIRYLIGPTLHGSTRIVNQGSFIPTRFFEIVEQFKVTVTICNVGMATQLADLPEIEFDKLNSIKLLCSGGNKISNHIIKKMNKYLNGGKFCLTYGMTETVSTIAVNLTDTRHNCVGQLISGYEAKVVNEYGEQLGIDEAGELCLKCPYPFLGYLGDGQNHDYYFDSEGFFRTGDIARFDKSNNLFIIDRKIDIFKSLGYPVTPNEIEEYLNQIDGVKQSCVVPVRDDEFEKPAALIVKVTNSMCRKQLIYNAVASKLTIYTQRFFTMVHYFLEF